MQQRPRRPPWHPDQADRKNAASEVWKGSRAGGGRLPTRERTRQDVRSFNRIRPNVDPSTASGQMSILQPHPAGCRSFILQPHPANAILQPHPAAFCRGVDPSSFNQPGCVDPSTASGRVSILQPPFRPGVDPSTAEPARCRSFNRIWILQPPFRPVNPSPVKLLQPAGETRAGCRSFNRLSGRVSILQPHPAGCRSFNRSSTGHGVTGDQPARCRRGHADFAGQTASAGR